MSAQVYYLSLVAVFLAAVLYAHLRRQRRKSLVGVSRLQRATESGLSEPPSLHPVVDLARCVGSGACVAACPEKALGFVGRKAQLVDPSACIGHGACAATCPVEAITLVFGTERRGVEIPQVKPTFESNVPGIFIAGELGGMGLIGKSAEQGRQAIGNIVSRADAQGALDVVIVGAGPAGIGATLAAMQRKLRFVTIEQEDSLGGTVYHYPRNKVAMTHPVILPLVGLMKLGEVRKEALLAFWQGVIDKVGAPISFGERLEGIERDTSGFTVTTGCASYRTANVLLAVGRRGSPRKLEVPGEESPHVVYRLVDPKQYAGQSVLVVGGGDSAIEAALALAAEPDVRVALSYRSEAFSRAKAKNRSAIEQAQDVGEVTVLLGSNVVSVTDGSVELIHDGEAVTLAADAVIVCAGGILPMGFLRSIGINVETKFGTK